MESTSVKLLFRPLEKADFALFAQWLGEPHVARWWREPATVAHVAQEYGACTEGNLTTRVYVVEADGRPIGIMQTFMLESYPEYDRVFGVAKAASIDYLIGEQAYVGRGVGAQMIRAFVERVVREVYPQAVAVATSAEVENGASLGALRKAGFEPGKIITGEYGTPERVMVRGF
jgi:aminoglycoside 6'-N-acetyltransferase